MAHEPRRPGMAVRRADSHGRHDFQRCKALTLPAWTAMHCRVEIPGVRGAAPAYNFPISA